jgi:hypothetical protein
LHMKQSRNPDFDLTAPEKELLAKIRPDQRMLNGYEDETRNGNAVCALMKSLLARHAIPVPRVKYFIEPAYHLAGREKSRKQVFERNGCIGDEIFRHPHFLEYLRYFLYGADLPDAVTQEFRSIARFMGEVTPKSITFLSKPARNMARAYALDPHEAGDEFYKLGLDCGLKPAYADDVRRAVRKNAATRRGGPKS